MLNCPSVCADAIQTKPHRLKMFILYSQKVHRTNVSISEKIGERTTFLTLVRRDGGREVDYGEDQGG